MHRNGFIILIILFFGSFLLAEIPRVIRIAIVDPTPNNSNGIIYPQIFDVDSLMIEIEFDRDMDRTVDLTENDRVVITWGNNRVIPVKKGAYITDRYWVGSVSESEIVSAFSYSGNLYVTVKDALDINGNKINSQTSAIYYLDIGPRFSQPQIFQNPIFPDDYIITVSTSEELQAPPQVIIFGESIEMKAISPLRYIGSIHLKGLKFIGPEDIRISGTDLQGNIGTWPKSLDDILSPWRMK